MDSTAEHRFTFTQSISIFVQCESGAEIDGINAKLANGGEELMQLGNYGFSTRFGWVNDRYGVSWQMNLQ
jgi:predicted 3-demethylubiquinone-9 3-methyltransferase (glyoxalase superfamily)